MKNDIHPAYYAQTKVRCACGSVFAVGSTVEGAIEVEICSQCHPFYTGQEKVVDTAGRVERFRKMVRRASEQGKTAKAKKQKVRKDQQHPAAESKSLMGNETGGDEANSTPNGQ